MEPRAGRGQDGSGGRREPGAGLVRTFLTAPILKVGIVLVAIFVLPLVLVATLDPESNPVGLGLMFACMGVPSVVILAVGVAEGCVRVGCRVRERRGERR